MTEKTYNRGQEFLKALRERTLLLDGSTGVEFQRMNLSECAVRGRRFMTHTRPLAANFDILALSRPELVATIHRSYLDAGADIIETDTFNANRLSQREYATAHLVSEINHAAASIAVREARRYTDRPRFVAGSIGPTALSASLPTDVNNPAFRAVSFDTLAEAYSEQSTALIEGGVDFLLIETIFDLLNAKAAAEGARRAMETTGVTIPLVFSFTISDTSGRILSGHTPEAILATMAPYNPAALGFNCSAGPQTLTAHARALATISPFPLIFYPNAGLPDRMGRYDMSPEEFADTIRPLIAEHSVSIVGGCCGTSHLHIAALSAVMVDHNGPQLLTVNRSVPWLAGMEAFHDDRGFINVGERCNVAGSRKFLRLVNEKKYDEALAIARRQVEDGAMILDINMDDAMLDRRAEMTNFLRLLGSDPVTASVPWMIDSSDFGVIEDALRNIGGRAIVNSISLKHGEEEFIRQASVIRRYGAAVVVMLFDEKGQADTLDHKKEVAARAISLLTDRCGFAPRDIVIDPNVLTIATGMPEHDAYALWFIEAVRWITTTYPGVKTSGGVSNLSFSFRGNNRLRQSMHAVFLYHAIRNGLSMAIVDPSSKVTYNDIPADLLKIIEDSVLFRHPEATAALAAAAERFLDETADTSAKSGEVSREKKSVADRLTDALIHGDDSQLAGDIPEAVTSTGSATAVVDTILMGAMEEVGRRFETGKMFLPQVVKSARTMHCAVKLLEPYLEGQHTQASSSSKGRFLIATVRGDVHDIGKNIAAVVLRCNNYDVIDLGVQVDAQTIVRAVREHKPDFIALSGLISPSLEEMARTLSVLHEAGISIPVFVGGAATSDLHTALALAPAYGDGVVARVSDASRDPVLAARLTSDFAATAGEIRMSQQALADEYRKRNQNPVSNHVTKLETDWSAENFTMPTFAGIRTLEEVPVSEITPYINWTYFYNCWKVRPGTPEADSLRADAEAILQSPALKDAAMRCQVAFYDAHSDGGDNIIVDNRVTIATPRQRPSATRSLCLALSDYIAPEGYGDHIGCFVVTLGDKLRTLADSAEDDYHRLLIQSLCDRVAEATSEWLHRRVRTELWGYAPDEPLDMTAIRQARYRGIRPAVGYPSLPDQCLMFRLMDLLDPEAIGVSVTVNGALWPSSTVAGFYIASPRARYFSV